MKTIKNFEGFKKSLLTATNGTMEETFDSSVLFSGREYHSYRVYVDAIHYYNMFVIHNFATNTYDVALETACCGTSTMSRKIKTQKSLIESVVAWISCNYLNTKKIDSDSEEYTDMCENSETENAECAGGNDVFEGCKTVKDVMEVKQELNSRFGKDQYFDTDDLQPNQNTCCSIGYTGRKKEIMTANISDLQHIASTLIAGGWTSKDAKEIQLEYNLCDDEVNAIVEIMEEMWKNRK